MMSCKTDVCDGLRPEEKSFDLKVKLFSVTSCFFKVILRKVQPCYILCTVYTKEILTHKHVDYTCNKDC